VLLLLVITVASMNVVNRRVETHRLKVFKLIVQDQMTQLGPHLAGEVSRIPTPCETCATPRESKSTSSTPLLLDETAQDVGDDRSMGEEKLVAAVVTGHPPSRNQEVEKFLPDGWMVS